MASFCKQCSEELFGEDFEDLRGITTIEDEAKGLAAIVTCEGCGDIQVDSHGRCISYDCDKQHNPSHEDHE
jgi:hypothetical protein